VTLMLAEMGMATAFGIGVEPALKAYLEDQPAFYGNPNFVGTDFQRQICAFQNPQEVGIFEETLPHLVAQSLGDLIRRLPLHPHLNGLETDVIVNLPEAFDGDGLGETRLGAVSQDLLQKISGAMSTQRELVTGEVQAMFGGAAGCAQAIVAAQARAKKGRSTLLICADSYNDRTRLTSLCDQRRLFSIDTGYGLVPGEAAGAMLLVPEEQMSAPAFAQIHAAGSNIEPVRELESRDGDFTGLSDSAFAALDGLQADSGELTALISDWNNSRYRASEMSYTLHRLAADHLYPGVEPDYPSLTFGDCGAAYFPLALVQALALSNPLEPGSAICLSGTTRSGERGAVVLEAGPLAARLINTLMSSPEPQLEAG